MYIPHINQYGCHALLHCPLMASGAESGGKAPRSLMVKSRKQVANPVVRKSALQTRQYVIPLRKWANRYDGECQLGHPLCMLAYLLLAPVILPYTTVEHCPGHP